MNRLKEQSSRCFVFAFFISIFFCQSFRALGQDSTGTDKNFTFTYDYNRFRYSDSLIYVEYYIVVYRDILKFMPQENDFVAEFISATEVWQNDSLIYAQKILNRNSVDSLEQVQSNQRIYSAHSFALAPGDYQVKISINDQHAEKKKEHQFDLHLDSFSNNNLNISDIQLASNIQRDTSKSIYVKNGYMISPNPDRLYGIGLPILFSYVEIYGLTPSANAEQNVYKIGYKILDSDGNEVKSVEPKLRNKPGGSAVEVNRMNVVTLVSGPYVYVMEVEDLATGEKVSAQKKFFVYREADFKEGGLAFEKREKVSQAGSPGMDASRYDIMSEKELNQEFDWAQYIATPEEKNFYKTLNLEGKRTFLKEFWSKRDETPGTPENEYKRDYLKRVEHANNTFKGPFRSGYRADQGRIMLAYGYPDDIERYPQTSENRPYEIWHYYAVQGGVIFVFVDKRNMGEMELVHSTAYGELYDDSWTRWIEVY
jgi:GWxTD domain-containing protein